MTNDRAEKPDELPNGAMIFLDEKKNHKKVGGKNTNPMLCSFKGGAQYWIGEKKPMQRPRK